MQEFSRRVGGSLLESLRSTSAPGASSPDLRGQVDDILGKLRAVGYVEDYTVDWRKPGGESLADEPDLRVQLRVRVFYEMFCFETLSRNTSGS